MTIVQYGGWTDDTYLHVIPREREGAKVDITLRTLQQLDGVVYNMEARTTASRRGVPLGVPVARSQDVRICTWNCRGIPRASFRLNLYTLRIMAGSVVVVVTETYAS